MNEYRYPESLRPLFSVFGPPYSNPNCGNAPKKGRSDTFTSRLLLDGISIQYLNSNGTVRPCHTAIVEVGGSCISDAASNTNTLVLLHYYYF